MKLYEGQVARTAKPAGTSKLFHSSDAEDDCLDVTRLQMPGIGTDWQGWCAH